MARSRYGEKVVPKPPAPPKRPAPKPKPTYSTTSPSKAERAFRSANTNIGRPAPNPDRNTAQSTSVAPTRARSRAQRPQSRYKSLLADSLFRADRVALQTTLQDTLAQILFEKQGKYRDLGTARTDWTRARGDEAQALGANFAARGLGSSGLYRQGLDELMANYQRSANQLDALQQDIAQQYGAQGSLTAIDPTSLYNADDYTALASVYGLLGQRGTSAGQQYGAALNQARAAAAARAGQSIFSQAGF